MNYNDVAKMTFYQGRIRDGYAGDTLLIKFALVGTMICVVHESGYYNAGLPPVETTNEAIQYLTGIPHYTDGKPYIISDDKWLIIPAASSPRPRTRRPSIKTLEQWHREGGCEATDGCWVEPDGTCGHGCKSWLLELGLI